MSTSDGWNAMMDAGWESLRLTAPFAVAGVIVGVVASAIQVKPGITIEVLKPRFGVLNPLSGFKRLFSPRSAVGLVKDLLKIDAHRRRRLDRAEGLDGRPGRPHRRQPRAWRWP